MHYRMKEQNYQMNEHGKIVEIKNNIAKIEFERNDACQKCGMCFANLLNNKMYIKFPISEDFKIDDQVQVIIEKSHKTKAIIFLLGVPILTFMLSSIISSIFIKNDFFVFLLAFGCLALSFLIVKFLDVKFEWSKSKGMRVMKLRVES